MNEDRRDSPRRFATLPAQIETDAGRVTIAVTQDVSATGLQVLSEKPLAVGTAVTLYLLLDSVQYEISGKIVRQEELALDERTMWRWRAGVAVDSSDADLATVFAAISRA